MGEVQNYREIKYKGDMMIRYSSKIESFTRTVEYGRPLQDKNKNKNKCRKGKKMIEIVFL